MPTHSKFYIHNFAESDSCKRAYDHLSHYLSARSDDQAKNPEMAPAGHKETGFQVLCPTGKAPLCYQTWSFQQMHACLNEPRNVFISSGAQAFLKIEAHIPCTCRVFKWHSGITHFLLVAAVHSNMLAVNGWGK